MATMQTDFKHLVTVKPSYCYECGYWKYGKCNGPGYQTSKDSRSCRQAVSKRDLRRAGY
ncbi:MAG: hypothetical protein ABSB71_09930 [Candidatus Bathyarchaeia archaeon]